MTIFCQVVADFEEQWAHGIVEGWETESQENGLNPETVINLKEYNTVEELIKVGPELLKEVIILGTSLSYGISLHSFVTCSAFCLSI